MVVGEKRKIAAEVGLPRPGKNVGKVEPPARSRSPPKVPTIDRAPLLPRCMRVHQTERKEPISPVTARWQLGGIRTSAGRGKWHAAEVCLLVASQIDETWQRIFPDATPEPDLLAGL